MRTGRESGKGLFPAGPGTDAAGQAVKTRPAAWQDAARLAQTAPASCPMQQHRQRLSSSSSSSGGDSQS